jgi:hypothetical protein
VRKNTARPSAGTVSHSVTLLVALANPTCSILLADRRITRQDGSLIDDEFNKLCVVFCHDAKLAVAFTGIATSETFNTADWLANTIADIGKDHPDVASMLAELKNRAEIKIQSLNELDRRLTIVLSGFVYWGSTPEPRTYILSNFEHQQLPSPVFTLRTISANESVIVEVAGTVTALPQSTINSLRKLLQERLSARDIARFAVKHLQLAARDGRSAGRIGEQCNTAVLLAQPDTVVTSTYHSTRLTHRAYSANVVFVGSMVTTGAQMVSPLYLAGPEIRKQDPCWCGSGEKFKHCHMKKFGAVYARLPGFKMPLPLTVQFRFENPYPSGKVWCVTSSFE